MLAQPFVSAFSTANRFRMQTSHFIVNQVKDRLEIFSMVRVRCGAVSLYFSLHLLLELFLLNSVRLCLSIQWHSIDCQFLFNILSIKFNHSIMEHMQNLISDNNRIGLDAKATFVDCTCSYLAAMLRCSRWLFPSSFTAFKFKFEIFTIPQNRSIKSKWLLSTRVSDSSTLTQMSQFKIHVCHKITLFISQEMME